MPPLALQFGQDVTNWIDLARAGDIILLAAVGIPDIERELARPRLEALYELAYLRLFLSWETYLEESFRRLACGYVVSGRVAATLVPPAPFSNLAAADQAILGSRDFVSWANPGKVVSRSRDFATNGPHELVLSSSLRRLEAFNNLRNRIAHPSGFAKAQFAAAATLLVGHGYRGTSAGRFLRSWDRSLTPPVRMLDSIGSELAALAQQISS
jgi:hypothetical protein